MGIKFFFTFPTSEGSDLLSSHVMQTPTFISKLSDGNVIFRLDVGKNCFPKVSTPLQLENIIVAFPILATPIKRSSLRLIMLNKLKKYAFAFFV
jgi:hypothetical protein